MGTYATLSLKREAEGPGVLTVELNRPEIRNAFNTEMIQDLSQAFTKDAREEWVRLVVLRGAGPIFSAGGDLNWMRESIELDTPANLKETLKLARTFSAINECPHPVIGVVQGAAIGGGVGLVSVCDIVVAVEDAVFSLSEVRLGIIPACIGPFVIPKIGPTHARALFISAERFTAEKAFNIGLIHQVAPTFDAANEFVKNSIKNMSQCGPAAMAAAKQLVLNLSVPERRAKLGDPLEYVAKSLAELRTSPEGQEGVRAFLEKRKPSWLDSKSKGA